MACIVSGYQGTKRESRNVHGCERRTILEADGCPDVLWRMGRWGEENEAKARGKAIHHRSDFHRIGENYTHTYQRAEICLNWKQRWNPPLYIIGRVLLLDDPAKEYSKLRGLFGSNHHPDLHEAVQATAKMHARSAPAFEGTKRGNAGKKDVKLSDMKAPKTKKAWGP